MKQILFEYAREIAGEFSGQAKQDYLNALDDVRLPYVLFQLNTPSLNILKYTLDFGIGLETPNFLP